MEMSFPLAEVAITFAALVLQKDESACWPQMGVKVVTPGKRSGLKVMPQ